ncbi:EGF-like domain-containing protein [Dictyostelium discoideum AX4]|uniref:EGF-like domain-containing protein n=1 Tax=Dictyostelium discoideum TaxID=44689 RepID=Q54YP0_DICDI|nr:EGF-like domain-containing protein [Dictyostelium discoideum AX4]EAL68479.1 EGF-like domain-containing protein [Dictyostelium discoideum AX4]|eukprot:XP_642162.1 EGF-like domain-containing protein [Dictyostelium discoideum AX4]
MKIIISLLFILLSFIKISTCIDCKDFYSPEGNPCPCLSNPCGFVVSCYAFSDGSYLCGCNLVTEVFDDGTKTCVDRDECADGSSGCSNGCSNRVGGFDCTCPTGYRLNSDLKSCSDIDECAEGSSGCSNGCSNSGGSFTCTCPAGYRLGSNGKTCEVNDPCASSNCEGTCVASGNSFTCSCGSGYTLSSNGYSCNDIDECAKGTDSCAQGCTNNDGGYSCSCSAGYTLASNGYSCNDIDECAKGTYSCAQGCTNNDGGYSCSCSAGYTLASNGYSCNDIDECAKGTSGCAQSCSNTDGGYSCSCSAGYTLAGDGKTCTDIDECAKGTHGCAQGCSNTIGGYSCYCGTGFELGSDGKSCTSINDCDKGASGCSQGCLSNNGGYTCYCNSGYSLGSDEKTCNDIDECSSGSSGCTQLCSNSPGTYSCSCKSGYSLGVDSKTCNDIDECQTNVDGCEKNCNNIAGSFYCSCDSNYFLNSDNKTCNLISSCLTGNGGCQHNCSDVGGSITCSCGNGYSLDADNKSCSDVDECANNPCSANFICENKPGSFACVANVQPKHYISSVIPSTTLWEVLQAFMEYNFNNWSPAGSGKHSVNLTQNGVVFIGNNIYQYESIIKACPKDCSNENQGTCNTVNGECKCKQGFDGFDCSIKLHDNSTITVPENEVTVGNGESNISNQDTNFKIYFKSLKEISFNGETIQTFNLSDNWKLVTSNVVNNQDTNNNYLFTQTLKNTTCTVTVTIEEVKQDSEFSFAGTTFTVSKGLVKFTISIANYQYSSFLNTLQLEMISMAGKVEDSNYNNDCNNKDTEIETNSADQSTTSFNVIKISKNNKILGARFINRVISDGKPTFLSTTIKNETDSIIVVLNLPHCTKECLIDPDFSLLVDPQFKPECESKSRKWVVPVAVVVSVVGFSGLAVAGFILYKKQSIAIKVQIHKLKRFNQD